jgi:hypothetical protein
LSLDEAGRLGVDNVPLFDGSDTSADGDYIEAMNLGPLEFLILLVLLVVVAGLLLRSVVRRR